MAEEYSQPEVDLVQVAEIVGSYVRHNQVAADQVPSLIVEVHRGFANLGRGTPPVRPAEPAVPIRRSVQPNHVICLECGYRAQVLRRHLRVAHNLEVADYRARWKLREDHPIIAPNYSARRSAMAREIGLGRRRTAAEPSPPPAEQAPAATATAASGPVSRRGGRRPRRTPAAT